MRVGLGLALAFIGFAHYQDPLYAEQVGRGLGVLESIGMAWGFVLPALLIFGGVLLAFGIYMRIAAFSLGIALGSIPMGLMLKSAITGIPLDETMPQALNALIWIIVFLMVAKGGCCCSGESAGCCSLPAAKIPAVNPMKAAPSVMVKPVAKKPNVMQKKAAGKKA